MFNELRLPMEQEGLDFEDMTKMLGDDPRIGNFYNVSGKAWGKPCFPKDTQAFLYQYPNCDLISAAIDLNKKYFDAGRYDKTDLKYFSEVWGWKE